MSNHPTDVLREFGTSIAAAAECPDCEGGDHFGSPIADFDAALSAVEQLETAARLGREYAEGVRLREQEPFIRGIHDENVAKINAALALFSREPAQ